jgi:hypothetical protein
MQKSKFAIYYCASSAIILLVMGNWLKLEHLPNANISIVAGLIHLLILGIIKFRASKSSP